MGVGERVLEVFGIATAAQIEERIGRAFEAGYFDGYEDGNDDPASGDLKRGGHGYKRMSDSYLRESQIDFQKALSTAWSLWQKSPIAKRVLVMKRDHIIGHNVAPSASDDKLLETIKEFWRGNKLDKRSSEFVLQLFGFGEQCYPAFVRESDGRVRIGYVDPQSIAKVIKHPENSMEDWIVVVERYSQQGHATQEKLCYRIIRKDEPYVAGNEAQQAEHEGKLATWEQATLEPWGERC
jgi:hypothetical protein